MSEMSAGCDVAILVGGLGTRLKSRTGDLPKPMARLGDKPVLGHLIDLCREHGFKRIALLAGYGHQTIKDYFGDGSAYGVRLTYCIEREARGTAGALCDALPKMASRFFVIYGDTYANVDLHRMLTWHRNNRADATLFLHPNDHPEDSDLVSMASDGTVTGVHPYPRPEDSAFYRNLVNAALYIFEKAKVTDAFAAVGKADIAKHTLPLLLNAGVRVMGYVSPEYIKDMGTPERLDRVAGDIAAGLPARLAPTGYRTAVFLDRDGTLNKEAGHIWKPDDLHLLPGVGQAVRSLNRAGFLAILVTNQPVIARGETDLPGLELIHAKLETLLGREGAYLDAIYFCPHHPDSGYDGERRELKFICKCRKPAIGMFEAAVVHFGIDVSNSWMIGDSKADILAGSGIGVSTILVETGQSGCVGKFDADPDHRAKSLVEAVGIVLGTPIRRNRKQQK